MRSADTEKPPKQMTEKQTIDQILVRLRKLEARQAGASSWDSLTGTVSSIPFDPATAPAHSEGKLYYDETDHSLTYYTEEPEVSMNIGREMWVRVRNNTGSTIANGKVVYLSGATGQTPTIALARADSLTTSRVIGIATHDIENNTVGYVTTFGEVKELDTSAFTDGDTLYLSAAAAGEMTTTAPTAPNRIVQVATVSYAHGVHGKLYCHPEMDSVQAIGISDSTSTGRSMVTAADAAAARTALGMRAFTKSADQSKTSDTTYANDSELKDIPLESGKSYKIDFFLAAYVPTTEGGKARLVVPLATGTVPIQCGIRATSQWGNGSAAVIDQTTSGSVRYMVLAASAGYNANRAITGVAYTGILASSGNLSLQWAQNTSGVNATILRAGSLITVTEL
jgi:hypothetical protein